MPTDDDSTLSLHVQANRRAALRRSSSSASLSSSSSSTAAPASSAAIDVPLPVASAAPGAQCATVAAQHAGATAGRLHTSKVTLGEFDAEAKATDLRKFAGMEYTKQKKPSSLKDISQQYREFASQLPSRRKRESRFIEVDGHTVLKLNNYSQQEGESSVYKSEVQRSVAQQHW